MTVRWNSGDLNGVTSGYIGGDVPAGTIVPTCGIEDVDRAVFTLFDAEIGFQTIRTTDGKRTSTKVPVFFGAGEKWALNKRRRAFRDKQGTLILPLISIVRTGIEQHSENDQLGRGINQATGEVVLKRRIAPEDRDYQNLVNRFLIPNQENLATGSSGQPISSEREVGRDRWDPAALSGDLLSLRSDRVVWEIITIPTPQFYTAQYEITFWTQYTDDMNSLQERLMAAMLPQLPCFKVTTTSGYWFVAFYQGEMKSSINIDDMNENERVIKYSFNISVRAYTVAPALPGMPSPVRRFVSSPEVSFDVSSEIPGISQGVSQDPNTDNADDPTLGYTLSGESTPRASSERSTFRTRITKSPFSRKERITYVKIVSVNARSGESIVKPINPGIEFEVD